MPRRKPWTRPGHIPDAAGGAAALARRDRSSLAILDTTGKDFNNPASPFFHQYSRGYQAINTLFPASFGYTQNSLERRHQRRQSAGRDRHSRHARLDHPDPAGRQYFDPRPGRRDPRRQCQRGAGGQSGERRHPDAREGQHLHLHRLRRAGGAEPHHDRAGRQHRHVEFERQPRCRQGRQDRCPAPPPKFDCDIDWICSADIKGEVSGAGISTLQSLPGVPAGNANLIAPRGTVDAGAAGIRVSGNLNIAALQVLNAFNIQVQGVTVGVPAPTAPNIGALSDASAASGAATKADHFDRAGQNSPASPRSSSSKSKAMVVTMGQRASAGAAAGSV